MRPVFLLIAGIVLLSGCTGQPSATPYQLPGTDIRLSYPPGWTAEQLNPAVALFSSPSDGEADPFLENVNVLTQTVPAGTTLDTYVQEQVAVLKESSPTIQMLGEVQTTLAGSPAWELGYTETSDGLRTLQTITIKDNTVMIVTYTAAPDAYDRYLPQARQIAGTLQIGASSPPSAPAAFPTSATEDTTPAPQAPVTSIAGFVGTWRVRGQQTSRMLEIRSGGVWIYGSSRGTWSVQPIVPQDWPLWETDPYGPTNKMVLDNWDSGQASGPVEYSPDVAGRVDAFWLINEKVMIQFIHANDAI